MGFALNRKALRQLRLVLEELRAPYKREQKEEADARGRAAAEAMNPIQLLSSSSSREQCESKYDSEEEFQFESLFVDIRHREDQQLHEELVVAQAAHCM